MIVTLLTDFGTRDGYVGAMKGAVLERCPTVAIHDITHDVDPGDVRGGALALEAAAPWFPSGTIHVAVVDPGVGTDRRALLVTAGGSHLVGPDNGVLSLAARMLAGTGGIEIRVLDRSERFRPQVSPTFHGRDVFAPVAGSLAAGAAATTMGSATGSMQPLDLPDATRDADGAIVGLVVHADRFGNLITNVTEGELASTGDDVAVEIAGVVIGPLRRTYGEVATGESLALVGSGGRLEVAVRDGSATRTLGVGVGADVRIARRGS